MDRRSSGIFSVIASFLALTMAGCTGNSTPGSTTATVEKVTLTPSTGSMDVGSTLSFTSSGVDAKGQAVLTGIQFVSDCPQQPCATLSVSTGGLACAGSWDSLTNPVLCTPGNPGFAQVIAQALGVSSPPATVYVHQHIDSIQITPVGTHQCSKPPCECFSQGENFTYQAKAFSNGNDITSTVGPLTWAATPLNVVTTNSSASGLLTSQVEATAKNPGIAQLFATVSGVTSNPLPYTACLVSSIMLNVQGDTGNQVSVSTGGSKTIEATVLDTMGNAVSNPILTWNTSNPEIAGFTSASSTTGSNSVVTKQSSGSAVISAACTPPACNIGVPGLPVYSSGGLLPNGSQGFGVIKVKSTPASGTNPPTFNAFAATTGCGTTTNCSSVMFPVSPAANPIGASVLIPRTPNSMMFTPSGTRIYLGSDAGLMFFDTSATTVSLVSSSSTPCNVSLCGKILAISPDGTRVVVSDNTTTIPPHPPQVYIYDTAHTSTPVVLPLAGATAAAFSPDEMKVFILTNTAQLFVYSTVDSLLSVPLSTPATDVAFSANGSFAYLAASPANSVSAFATCNGENMPVAPPLTIPGNPLRIFPLPSTQETILDREGSVISQNVLALEPPILQILNAQFTQDPVSQTQFSCNIPSFDTNPPFTGLTAGQAVDLGQGNFVPLYMRVVGDGSQAILVAQNIPAVFVIDLNAKTASAIPMVNSPQPLAASASPDGTTVFVAACDAIHPDHPDTCGSIHIVNVPGRNDTQQAVFTNPNTSDSMCSDVGAGSPTCISDLIAVRPQ